MGKALQSMPRSLPPMMSLYTLTPAFLTLKRTRLVGKTFHSLLTLSCWCQSKCMSPCYFQVVMVFPGPQAVSVQDMIQCLHDQRNSRLRHTSYEPMKKRLKCDDLGGSACTTESFQTGSKDATKDIEPRQCLLQRVVFIDSTWNQTNKISTDERLQGNQKLCTCLFFKSFRQTYIMRCIKTTLLSDVALDLCFSSRFAASRAEDEKNLFLAPSEGKTRLLPGYYWSYLLFP